MPRAPFRLPQAASRGCAPPRAARRERAPFCREATPRVGQASRSGVGVPVCPACPGRRSCGLLFARQPCRASYSNPSCPLLRQTISSRSEGCLKPSPNREDNNGRYHNHHLLLVRRLLEGLGAPTRPTSPLVHRRGDVGLPRMSGRFSLTPPLPPRV